MARLFATASSQYLSNATAIRTAAPMTVSAWCYPASAIANGVFRLSGSAHAADDLFLLSLTGGNTLEWHASLFGGNNAAATTANTATLNAWNHVLGVETSADLRSARLNGGTAATNATNVIPGGIDTMEIGVHRAGGGATYFDGRIADVGVWSVALDADEQVALAKGFSPLLVRPQSLLLYLPLFGNDSPEVDRWKSGLSFTLAAAPTKADGPRLYAPVGAA